MIPTLFEQSVPGRRGYRPDEDRLCPEERLPASCLRASPPPLPEVSELDVVRHHTRLAHRNFSLDTHLYPLGSCTMKYNPRFTERLAGHEGLRRVHPFLARIPGGAAAVQGLLRLFVETERLLCAVTGMDRFTFQPLAGAHGESTGVMMISAYHRARGERRTELLVPDSAHGTNPASAALAGFRIVPVETDRRGLLDPETLRRHLGPRTAGLMLTCPNTLGLFNPRIVEITRAVHEAGGLTYYDGANLNAILGRCRPGDLGFDVMHLNLHKTFATPHGGGGPGSGPVGVKDFLAPFLPSPRVVRLSDGLCALDDGDERSIGPVSSFYGNTAVVLRAYAYMLLLGREGLRETSGTAVLNANYVAARLRPHYEIPFPGPFMHEVVVSARRQARRGVHAADIAKFLVDAGFHPPTMYFPLIVKEALMIEPTECESLPSLDAFIEALIAAARTAEERSEDFRDRPRTTPVCRPDEALAARRPRVTVFDAPLETDGSSRG